jgi:hypothetical protein
MAGAIVSTGGTALNLRVGEESVGSALKEAVQGKMVQDRTQVVSVIESAGKASACHVLFVSSSERKHFPSITLATADLDVLTVGDSDSFIADMGMINLNLEDSKVRIEINPRAARRTDSRCFP